MKNFYKKRIIVAVIFLIVGIEAVVLAVFSKNLKEFFVTLAVVSFLAILFPVAEMIKYAWENRPDTHFKGKQPYERVYKSIYKEVKHWDGKTVNATIIVNGHFQPGTRRSLEKAVNNLLEDGKVGKVVSGKCFYKEKMEVDRCEIYLSLKYEDTRLLEDIARNMDRCVPVPKGSLIQGFNGFHKVGVMSGLALYLQVSKMPYSEDAQSAYNEMFKKINEALENKVSLACFWGSSNGYITKNAKPDMEVYGEENPIIYAYYYYGTDYADMRNAIEPILKESLFADIYRIVQCS